MMYDIIVQVRNQRIKCVDQTIVSDSRNYQYVKFEFDSDWDGLIKTAVFRNGENVFNVLIDDTCRCLIPEGALKSGVLEISVFGGDRITATAACFNVVKSGYVSADAPPAPEPDVYASLVELAANAVNVANEVRADADSGKFNGAAGPQGPQGEIGPQGPQGEIGPAGKDGSSDWNTLQNKPFGEVREFEDIVWDGVTTGRDSFSASGFNFYKVSSDITDANMLDGHKLVNGNGLEVVFDSANFVYGTGITSLNGYPIVVVSALEFNLPDIGAGTAPSTGIYTFSPNSNFTISGVKVKKLDNQFIKFPVMIVAFSENFDNGKYMSSASLSEVNEAMDKNCLVVGYFPDHRMYLPNVFRSESGSCKFSAVYTSNLNTNAAEYIEFTLDTNQMEVTKTVKQIAFTT